MAIAKTASRNVAFKVAKMRESIMEDLDEFLIRKSEYEEVGLETNNKAMLEDVGQNAVLYILPIKRATRKIRRFANAEAELWTLDNVE